MSIMIVPEPLFDSNMAVEAYWLRAHDGKKILGLKDNFFKMDDAFTNAGLDIVEKIGLEPFIGDKILFVDLTRTQLMIGIPMNMKLDGGKLVCIVPAELASDEEAAEHIRILGAHGYRIALDGVPENADPGALKYVEFILLDYKHPQFPILHAKVKSEMENKRAVIFNVPHTGAFNNLKQNTDTYFAGGFYSQPITSGGTDLSPVKVNTLHLLNQVNQEDFDLTDIVKIIERDPYLSISLLRFINSSASGLKRQVESIMQAVAILGQTAVRQWAMIALSVSLAEDRPGEITRLALVRAKFAEDLAPAFELGVFQPSLFMSGLFSLLDVMLEEPMDIAIKEIAVDEKVREALVEKSGPLAPVMELIYAYERADWDKVSILMIQNNTDMERVSRAYLDALVWYRKLLQSIDESADREKTVGEEESN